MLNYGPFVRVGDALSDLVSRLTFRRDVLMLHGKGHRLLADFLFEVQTKLPVEARPWFADRLKQYGDMPTAAATETDTAAR